MKRISVLILMSWGCLNPLWAQSDTVIQGAENITPEAGQSFYTQQIHLKNNQIPEIKLINLQTKNIDSLPSRKTAWDNSFLPDIFIGTNRKQKYATLKIPLYKKSAGQVLQLTGYQLLVSYSSNNYSTKTAERPTGVSHSVLASGTWYKIAVSNRGIYKIDYNFLQSIGVNPSSVNPNDIRIYGNGGTMLPETVSDNQPDDLIQNAIEVHASGNTFGQNDYVLFYANGPVLWAKDSAQSQFDHTNNPYENKSYYFLNFDLGPGLRINTENATGSANQTYTDYNAYAVYDKDSMNIAAIGRTWWSNAMNSQTGFPSSTNLAMNLGNVIDTVYAEVHVANVNAASGNQLTMKVNGQTVQTFNLPTSISVGAETYYADQTQNFSFVPGTANLNIRFDYNPAGNGSAYLDYIQLNYKRSLTFTGNELDFRSWASAALPIGETAGYIISNVPSSGIEVWDITNPLQAVSLTGQQTGSTYTFTRAGGSLHKFIAFQGISFLIHNSLKPLPIKIYMAYRKPIC